MTTDYRQQQNRRTFYIPPESSCAGGYLPSLDHLMMTTDTLILGDFNAHHSAWYSSSTDTRGTILENMIFGSNFNILNWDLLTKLPGNANPSSPDVSLASLITSTDWQSKTKAQTIYQSSLVCRWTSPSTLYPILPASTVSTISTYTWGSNDLGLHVVEPSGNKRRLQIEITIILTVCCSSQRVSCLGSVRIG